MENREYVKIAKMSEQRMELYFNMDKNNVSKPCIHMYFGPLSSNMKEFIVGHK